MQNKPVVSDLFVEKMRPKSFERMIMLPRLKAALTETDKLNMHYIFTGTAGLGKTTAAEIITSGYSTLFLNISEEGNIDTLREKVNDFCSAISLDDDGTERIKCVILDEMDGASDAFYRGLRGAIEQFQSRVRFIGTANFINKIPEPILSRFTVVNFNPLTNEEENYLQSEYAKYAGKILSACNIKYTQEQLVKFVKICYPDMRKMVNAIQNLYISKAQELSDDIIGGVQFSYKELYELITDKNTTSTDFYKKIVGDYKEKYKEVLSAFGNDFPLWLEEKHPDLYRKHIAQIILITAEWQHKVHTMIDAPLAMIACCFGLFNQLKQ